MQLVYFLLVPSAIASAVLVTKTSPSLDNLESFQDIGAIWLSICFIVACFAFAAHWMENARRLIRSNSLSPLPSWLYHRHTILLWSWCLAQPFLLAAAGWTSYGQTMLFQAGVLESKSLPLLFQMIPCLALLVTLEMIWCFGTPQSTPSSNGTKPTWNHQLGWCIRRSLQNATCTWIVPILLPIAIASFVDTGQLVGSRLPDGGMMGSVLSVIGSSLAATIAIPHLFVWLIRARPTDDSIETIVKNVWKIGNIRTPTILQWPTGCRVANAAVVGLIGYSRKLLLTDALLQRLTDRELSMVVLHELAHCVRYHAWIRMAPTICTVAFLLLAMSLLHGAYLAAVCMILLACFLGSLVAVCWWTEYDADRVAVKLASQLQAEYSANDLVTALQKIYGTRQTKSSWLHPSCNQRVSAILSNS
jgi:Zn-dependent protease with chaperone function